MTTGRTAPEVPFQARQLLPTLSSYWRTLCTADQSEANTLFTFTSKVEVSFGRGVGGKRAHDQRKMYHFDEGGKLGGWLVKNKLIGGRGAGTGVIRAASTLHRLTHLWGDVLRDKI